SSLSGATLTFDDSAAAFLPDSGQIVSGTYRPSDFFPGEIFPSPAPSTGYTRSLSALNGSSPNGVWSLYVSDDTIAHNGVIAGGWSLSITTTNLVCCSAGSEADVSVTLSDSRDPAVTGNALAYTATVINSGPAPASSVVVNQSLPGQVNFVSA